MASELGRHPGKQSEQSFKEKRVIICEDSYWEVKQGVSREMAAELGSMKILSDFDPWGGKMESATSGNFSGCFAVNKA